MEDKRTKAYAHYGYKSRIKQAGRENKEH